MPLTAEEASYLHERILVRHGESLLAVLMESRKDVESEFVWGHPLVATLPAGLREAVGHARNFSETIHGAALLYNLMLAKLRKSADWTDKYAEALAGWAGNLDARWDELAGWYADLKAFWQSPALKTARIPGGTRIFVDRWLRIVFEGGDPRLVADSRPAADLIRRREVMLKRNRARLANHRALEMWSGAAGTAQLDFRWRTAQTILADIFAGMRREEAGDA